MVIGGIGVCHVRSIFYRTTLVHRYITALVQSMGKKAPVMVTSRPSLTSLPMQSSNGDITASVFGWWPMREF